MKKEDGSPRKKQNAYYQLKSHFKSYCNHTSIHGFQYFGQSRTVAEKIWWMITFVVTLTSCGFMIYLIYNKWRRSPVIVSLTTRDTPTYQVPFPAVTICPSIKFTKENITVLDLKQIMSKAEVTDVEKNFLENIIHLCEKDDSYIQELNRVPGQLKVLPPFSNRTFEKFLKISTYYNKGNETIATFMQESFSFDEQFRPILTEDGVCFAFNMLSTKDIFTEEAFIHPSFTSNGPKSYWVPQRGYTRNAGLTTYPRRALLSGAANSLTIDIPHMKWDIDYKCSGAEQGYKVILHHPTRLPRPHIEYMLVPYGKASLVSVAPQMMSTSDVVKNYATDKRDCYFPDERNLKFFKIYSKKNCDIECLANHTLKECDCVPFYMPREASTPVCDPWKLPCAEITRKKHELARLSSKLEELHQKELFGYANILRSPVANQTSVRRKRQENSFEEDLDEDESRCNCLKPCNDITYFGTATSLDFDWKDAYLDEEFNKSDLDFDYTRITVYLDRTSIFTTERNELYGPTDFLSNFGGLLGLFTGFSILSFMEIIYFCTLRIFGNRRLLGRWYGDEDET